jgi:hypothetical protein
MVRMETTEEGTRDLQEMQKEFEQKEDDKRGKEISLYLSAKIRVQRKNHLENDYEMFRLYWKREIEKALEKIGDIKLIVIMT